MDAVLLNFIYITGSKVMHLNKGLLVVFITDSYQQVEYRPEGWGVTPWSLSKGNKLVFTLENVRFEENNR